MSREILATEHTLRALARKHGQEHVFSFWEELRESERARLLLQLASIDFDLMSRLHEQSQTPAGKESAVHIEDIAPAPVIALPRGPEERARESRAREAGEALLAAGKIAAFVVAGGQGSRLGFPGPKGTYPIGPVSKQTLFQLHAQKILSLSRRHGQPIPWYIMVSEANEADTRHYFEENGYLGLGEDHVRFLQQDMLPAVASRGKFLLESTSRVFTSPNGHGGSLKALHDSGSLEDMRRRGIELIFYFQVDNPLVRICDPVALGYHALQGADMSTKVVRKRDASEKVGVLCERDGRTSVVEYSNMPEEAARATLPDGRLKFWAGSIGLHVLSVGFVERLNAGGFQLPYHLARKTVPYVETSGDLEREMVRPGHPNGIKFETFVFDALEQSHKSVTLEVRREEEFSPVKNATGEDSPEKCHRDMTALFLDWLEQCGATIQRNADGSFDGAVEIHPLTALDAAELRGKVSPDTVVRGGFSM